MNKKILVTKSSIPDLDEYVEEVGEETNAGTGCGGCQDDIQAILDEING
jgi:NAD(P)H-nitrite reductase large subunit